MSGTILVSGIGGATVGTIIGFKKMDYDRIPQAGVLAASFFVASLIHIPFAVTSVHLILNGLIGLMMGWGAFPIILIALTLQSIFFQFGGLTTLGVNTVIMALPAVVCFFLFRRLVIKESSIAVYASFACGSLSVFLSGTLLALALYFTGDGFLEISLTLLIAHLPVMIIEGVVTVFCVLFLKKVQPSLLDYQNSPREVDRFAGKGGLKGGKRLLPKHDSTRSEKNETHT